MGLVLRNILAVIVGWISGSVLNMGLINLGHVVYPIEGIDPSNMNELAAVMPTLSPEFFIFPFLAHALGTLLGGIVASAIAGSKHLLMALIVGAVFFLGGIAVNVMLPGPMWFTIADLLLAYFPMAWLGATLVSGMRKG